MRRLRRTPQGPRLPGEGEVQHRPAEAAGKRITNLHDADTAILVDLLRRAGEFQDALMVIAARRGAIERGTIAKMLDFEGALIARGDTACHTIEDAEAGDLRSTAVRCAPHADPLLKRFMRGRRGAAISPGCAWPADASRCACRMVRASHRPGGTHMMRLAALAPCLCAALVATLAPPAERPAAAPTRALAAAGGDLSILTTV